MMECAIKSFASAIVAIAILFTTPASGAVQTVDEWSVSQTPSGAVLSLAGIWPSGCRPDTAELSVTDELITILVPPPVLPPGTVCIAALTRWSLQVPLNGLADGSYIVRVTSYGSPEPPTSPAILIEFPIFIFQGIASLVQPVPVAGWQAYLLVGLMLLGCGWHRLGVTGRVLTGGTSHDVRDQGNGEGP
jgi:hypothetical protein